MNSADTLRAIVADNRAGKPRGIAAWCTAHPETLRAVFAAHRVDNGPILIEATCNQVNQHGGYTGMAPAGFAAFIDALASSAGVDKGRVILGGDHLGPNPWRALPAQEAMAEACAMVRAYVEAGFTKLHLDASMACADDVALSEETMAGRAAELCAAAEAARGMRDLVYVIGTEVPVPGGETGALETLAVTTPEAALHTNELHRQAFARRLLEPAFARVIALVAQPGVDFSNTQVFGFDPAKAAALSGAALDLSGAVFEAHSTDYQTVDALRALVAGHFGILKVGPALTFAFREAVIAMAAIEEHLDCATPSRVLDVIMAQMDADPGHWRAYVAAGADASLLRLYGLSDRIRYYWPNPAISAALKTLFANIDAVPVPPGLVSQFSGALLLARAGASLSERIIQAKVGAVVASYRSACDPTL